MPLWLVLVNNIIWILIVALIITIHNEPESPKRRGDTREEIYTTIGPLSCNPNPEPRYRWYIGDLVKVYTDFGMAIGTVKGSDNINLCCKVYFKDQRQLFEVPMRCLYHAHTWEAND